MKSAYSIPTFSSDSIEIVSSLFEWNLCYKENHCTITCERRKHGPFIVLKPCRTHFYYRDSGEGDLGEVLDFLIEQRGGRMDELVALAVVDNLWERLEGVRVARAGLGAFHSLIGGEGSGWGLVEQLLGEVYRKEGGDVNGLYHHSQGLGAMLRSGLGWLGSAPSAPHPR